MSREQAHQILDDAKRGMAVSQKDINEALKATGDLAHEWPVTDSAWQQE